MFQLFLFGHFLVVHMEVPAVLNCKTVLGIWFKNITNVTKTLIATTSDIDTIIQYVI